MVVPPGQVLKEARAAAKAGNHALALANYERFFDRALQDQGEDNNYYGVRLSYCLDEWARLGEKYPPARERLEAKANEALAAFEATGASEKFHDFQSIRDELRTEGRGVFAVRCVPRVETGARERRTKVHVESTCRGQEMGHLFGLPQRSPNLRYERALYKFDQSMEICLADNIAGW